MTIDRQSTYTVSLLRSLVIFCIVLAIVATVGLVASSQILRYNVYGSHTFSIAPRDMVVLDTSTRFCDGVRLVDENQRGYVYLYVFPSEPPLSKWLLTNLTVDNQQIQPGSYQYWYYYFNKGSTANLSTCARPSIDFNVLKGVDNFNSWSGKDDNDFNYFYRSYFSGECAQNPKEPNPVNGIATLNMRDRNQYYFIFDNTDYVTSNVDFKLLLNRTMYDLTALPSSSCHANGACDLPLNYASSQFVVVVANDSGAEAPDTNVDIKWSCSERSWYYGALFGGIGGGIVVVIIGIVFLFIWCQSSKSASSTTVPGHNDFGERTTLVTSSPSAPSAPPSSSYSDPEQKPPSYNEATNM